MCLLYKNLTTQTHTHTDFSVVYCAVPCRRWCCAPDFLVGSHGSYIHPAWSVFVLCCVNFINRLVVVCGVYCIACSMGGCRCCGRVQIGLLVIFLPLCLLEFGERHRRVGAWNRNCFKKIATVSSDLVRKLNMFYKTFIKCIISLIRHWLHLRMNDQKTF